MTYDSILPKEDYCTILKTTQNLCMTYDSILLKEDYCTILKTTQNLNDL